MIRYQTRPLSLALRSDAGFAWGPIAQRNHGGTGLFTLDGTTSEGPGGAIVGLHANFEYRCGGTRPALRGTIRFHE